jgi:hypothetical protein
MVMQLFARNIDKGVASVSPRGELGRPATSRQEIEFSYIVYIAYTYHDRDEIGVDGSGGHGESNTGTGRRHRMASHWACDLSGRSTAYHDSDDVGTR